MVRDISTSPRAFTTGVVGHGDWDRVVADTAAFYAGRSWGGGAGAPPQRPPAEPAASAPPPRLPAALRPLVLLPASWALVEPERGRYDDAELDRCRKAVSSARKAGLEPMIVAHQGALPDWQLAREGWMDPDAGAGWGCYVDRLARAFGELVRYWISMWEPLEEAAAYDAERAVVGRALLDHAATAYLHLKRAPGTAGRPPWVGVVERCADWQEPRRAGPLPSVRGRLDAATRSRLGPEALFRVLATGRLAPPFAPVGELPNGTPALDFAGVSWAGGRSVTDDTPTGDAAPEALPQLLLRLGEHARPLLLVGAPAGAGARAWEAGVRVMGEIGS